MTLSDLRADCYRRLGYAASPGSDVEARITAFLNETQRFILAQPGLELLRDSVLPFSSVANQEYVTLPAVVARIKAITDRDDSRVLRSRGVRDVRLANANQTTGIPYAYAVSSYQAALAVDPSDASELFVKSTSASDTGTATIRGIRANLYPDTETVTMTGVTAVTFVHTDWTDIDKFFVSAPAVGAITLHEDSGVGTELSRIVIGATGARSVRILLEPVPSSVRTYFLDYVRNIEDLALGNDSPMLPADFHHILAAGARAKEYERRENRGQQQDALIEMSTGVRDLKYWIGAQGFAAVDRNTIKERSQLGAWFPAGS